jgi:hypothetical protein
VTDPLKHNANLVESLGSALRSGQHGLGTVPALLKQVLEQDGWRRFVTQLGEVVEHDRWVDFVTTPPLKGLGATDELIDRITPTDDPDLKRLLRDARKVGRGGDHKTKHVDSTSLGLGAEDSTYTAQRLAEQAPDEYEAVQRKEKTLNAAARAAGIRRPRIMVRLDNPESAARTLTRHMTPDSIRQLAKLLTETLPR